MLVVWFLSIAKRVIWFPIRLKIAVATLAEGPMQQRGQRFLTDIELSLEVFAKLLPAGKPTGCADCPYQFTELEIDSTAVEARRQRLHETTLRSVRRGEAELLAGPFCLWFKKNQVMPSGNGIIPSGNGI